jgi:hypothetical protein
MTWLDQPTVLVFILVLDNGTLEGRREARRVQGNRGRDFFEADPAGSCRIRPGRL